MNYLNRCTANTIQDAYTVVDDSQSINEMRQYLNQGINYFNYDKILQLENSLCQKHCEIALFVTMNNVFNRNPNSYWNLAYRLNAEIIILQIKSSQKSYSYFH